MRNIGGSEPRKILKTIEDHCRLFLKLRFKINERAGEVNHHRRFYGLDLNFNAN